MGPNGNVEIVLVSHSGELAQGLARLVRAVAGPDVPVTASGGGMDGTLGTDGSAVLAALRDLKSPAGAVILTDLGSTVLAVKAALADLAAHDQERIKMADAPLVEGGIAAAVAASTGASVADVVRAAEKAGHASKL